MCLTTTRAKVLTIPNMKASDKNINLECKVRGIAISLK